VSICSLRYSACNKHALYFHLWRVLYNIFPHYLIKGTNFEREKSYWKQVCFDFLYNFCLTWGLILRRNGQDTIKMYIGIHVKYQSLLSCFNWTWIFSTDFRKKKDTQIWNFTKICQVGTELFDAGGRKDRRTDTTNFIVSPCILFT